MPCLVYKREVWKLPILFLALLISLSACGGSRSIVGKWEAEVAPKRPGQVAVKVTFEFLPDGTFNAMPPGDTTIGDRGPYELLDDRRTLKFRSKLVGGNAVCKISGDDMQCQTDTATVNFKKL